MLGEAWPEIVRLLAQLRAAMTEMAMYIYDVLMTLMGRLGSLRHGAGPVER